MRFFRSILLLTVPVAASLLSGCTSHIPEQIRTAPIENPGVDQVRNQANSYIGDTVRWGGSIVAVENKAESTWVEIVATPLNHYGMPAAADESSSGRFIARIDGFLDPEVYHDDRRITVYGPIENRIVRTIDDYPYTYPLVKADSHYLWPVHYYASNYYYGGHRYYYRPYYHGYPYYYGYPYYPRHFHHRFGFHYGFRHW